MNKKILRVLTIISILIIIFGIFAGIIVKNDIINTSMPKENISIDGTDVTHFSVAFTTIGAGLLGIVMVFYSIVIVVVIWAIYGLTYLITKIIRKHKN